MASLMLSTLKGHPAGWGVHVLRSRCASLSGDGGLCVGGPEHRHKSSDAVGKLWREIHPEPIVAYPNGDAVKAPECCVWDPFHRSDNAAWRAVQAVPDAVKVFDISKQLENVLGQSEGLILFRGVASLLDEVPHTIRAPGGTRKIVYLSGSPSSIIENYRIIIASLHGRVAWIQEGHSSQKIGHVLDLANTLSDPQFVSFTLLLDGILSTVVRPFAKQVQAACEPAVFYGAQQRFRQTILDMLLYLNRCRTLMRVVCLCRQHAPVSDLRNLLQALLSQRGQHLVQFATHITGIVAPVAAQGGGDHAAPIFKRTRLVYPPSSHNKSSEMCLGPHCQCPARLAYHTKLWEDEIKRQAEGREKSDDKDKRPCININFKGRVRATRVSVPVAFTSERPEPNSAPLVNIPPRIAFLPRVGARPPNLDLTNMFRPRIKQDENVHESRCQVPHCVYRLHDAVDAAICSAITLLENLNREFNAILHSVGCNDDMSGLLRESATCWDWSVLAVQPPTVQHIAAFRNVCQKLRPLLIRTYYPTGEPFGGVSPCWPDENSLQIQYVMLCHRVRLAAAGDDCVPDDVRREASEWLDRTKKSLARPVWVNRVVEQVVRQRVAHRVWASYLRPAALISLFADKLPSEACEMWCIPSGKLLHVRLRKVRVRRRGKRKRSLSPPVLSRGFERGDLCVHIVNQRRALMYFEGSKEDVDVAKVAASLDMQSWFHIGLGVPRWQLAKPCWHAGRVHHRCRLLFVPDTACEGIGSFLRLAWDQRQGQASPVYHCDRAYLMQAGVACLGGERDELIVREVCRLLQATSKYKVSAGSKCEPGMGPAELKRDQAFAESGRFSGTLPVEKASVVLEPSDFDGLEGQGAEMRKRYLRERARAAKPVELPDTIKQKVSKVVSTSDIVQPLPLNIDVLHALQRGATHSVVQTKITSWLESKDGCKWKEERQELFAGGCVDKE